MGFIAHAISVLVAVFAISFFTFINYPAPPESPILFQWRSYGSIFKYYDFDIFYIDSKSTNEKAINRTVLCLHGAPTSSFDFFKIKPMLNKAFSRVLFIDFLGHGFSDKPRKYNYSISDQASLVEAMMEHLNVDSVDILSHDYGDLVAEELLSRQMEERNKFSINSVSLMNGPIFSSINSPLITQRLLRQPIIGTILGKLYNYIFFRITYESLLEGERYATVAELHDLWALVRHKDGYRAIGPVLSYFEELHENEDKWINAIKYSKVPVQCIYGKLDSTVSQPMDEYYRKFIPKPSVFVFANVGHYPHFESPNDVFDTFLNFIKRL